MRLQTLYLPSDPNAERPRFALILDRAQRHPDPDEHQRRVDLFCQFAEECGAETAFVTSDTVEIFDGGLVDGESPVDVEPPAPEEHHRHHPPTQELGALVAQAVRTYVEGQLVNRRSR